MLLPVNTVGRTPNVVVEPAIGCCWSIISAATKNPDAAIHHSTATDHPTRGPIRCDWYDFVPFDAVYRRPEITVELLVSTGKRWHGLAANDPNPAVVDNRVVQRTGRPRHILAIVDVLPRLAICRSPDIVLVVALITIATNDPHVAVQHSVSRRVTPLPIAVRVKRVVLKGVRFDQVPVKAVGGRPHFVVADPWEELTVTRQRIPTAKEPKPATKTK